MLSFFGVALAVKDNTATRWGRRDRSNRTCSVAAPSSPPAPCPGQPHAHACGCSCSWHPAFCPRPSAAPGHALLGKVPHVSSCLCSCSRSAPSSSSCAAQRHREGCPFLRNLCALHGGEGRTPGILREENGEDLRVTATDSQESGDQDRSKVQRCCRRREKLGRKIKQTAEGWEQGTGKVNEKRRENARKSI